MSKHKQVTCGKCLRIIQSDYLKSHMKQHEKRNETKIDEKALEEKIIQHIEYSQQQAVGEFLSNLIDGGEIKEEDLQFNYEWKQSLIVYHKNLLMFMINT